ncbi:unnamed protein product [Closterium sp. NIES-53]
MCRGLLVATLEFVQPCLDRFPAAASDWLEVWSEALAAPSSPPRPTGIQGVRPPCGGPQVIAPSLTERLGPSDVPVDAASAVAPSSARSPSRPATTAVPDPATGTSSAALTASSACPFSTTGPCSLVSGSVTGAVAEGEANPSPEAASVSTAKLSSATVSIAASAAVPASSRPSRSSPPPTTIGGEFVAEPPFVPRDLPVGVVAACCPGDSSCSAPAATLESVGGIPSPSIELFVSSSALGTWGLA